MPPDPSWTSLLPPLLAIGLAIGTRQVYLSLGAGVWLGFTILADGDPFAGLGAAIDGLVGVLGDAGNARVLLFTLVIGALIATVEASGGVAGFVDWLERRRLVTGPRGARVLAFLVGVVIFIESNITVLVAGAVSRPLFDRHRRSREMLAYLIDSTSAAVCVLIPLNAWGAYVLSLLAEQGVEDPVRLFALSVPYNVYAFAAVALAAFVAVTGWAVGPMRRAEERAAGGEVSAPGAAPDVDEEALVPAPIGAVPPRPVNMVVPLVVLVLTMPLGLFVTGRAAVAAAVAEGRLMPGEVSGFGVMLEGSGSTSVLWAVLAGLAVAWVLLLPQRALTVEQLTSVGLKGAGGMVGIALVLLLALGLGGVTRELGAGVYVAAGVAQAGVGPALLLPLVFLTGGFVAFSTGTSWGTFAIMIPIAVPAAAALGLPLAPFLAASLAGGIFGDHASPISDTTIVSSLAAATDHIAHVRTQLPYALLAGTVAVAGFATVGAFM
ncbi:Na+/H+ antiporter NhaC family protein [Rubrivirga sp. S365]|uniref:Na+/H+ antiporter NhaC family protein n=1 Tax=Rubrivirga sp. S365 TaxID=3076080 RepID=UPI0028C748AE|nr:Na+/H+ antiporter NhaC family protein [Rubrivirga sp. S365]MDT7855964.1 Na+/H+ antiporter NhaC family protein [Rubrivirga sp. S365]